LSAIVKIAVNGVVRPFSRLFSFRELYYYLSTTLKQ
jgi:hypothetical protein